jgi:DNA-binding LacI/PurR family transcriptional regulator/signal transduction histidine kinase
MSTGEPSDRRQRPVIGFLTDCINDDFQEQVWQAIAAAAEAFDVNLLCFIRGLVWEPNNTLFDLVDARNVDGVVALSTVLVAGMDEASLAQLYRKVGPVPIVSVGLHLPGFPSVVINNGSGIRETMNHLIGDHGRRRIAFVRGPANNAEAELRFGAYRESLERHGIAYEPARVFTGNFTRESGERAVRQFLADEVELDALVAANDNMALSAMRELQRSGQRIPDQVAVAGFDDAPDAASVYPALTTVRQPLRDVGWAAMARVLALIRGEAVPPVTALPAPAVIRRSCGCGVLQPRALEPPSIGDRVEGTGSDGELTAWLEAAFPGGEGRFGRPSWARDLTSALREEVEGARPGRLIELLDTLIGEGLRRQVAASDWYPVVNALCDGALPRYTARARASMESLFRRATQLVGTLAEQAQAAKLFSFRKEIRLLPNSFEMLHLDAEQVRKRIHEAPPDLGFPSLYLCRYADPQHERASLFLNYALDAGVSLDPAQATFPARQLVPGSFAQDRRYSFAVLPILDAGELNGFALCGMGPTNGTAYDFLGRQLSSALTVSTLMRDVRRYATDLEGLVEERTRQLRDAQRQLVEAARQAGMAELAVGVLHNVGNLINTVSVAADRIADVVARPRLEGLQHANDLLVALRQVEAAAVAHAPKLRLLPDYYSKFATTLHQDRAEVQRELGDLYSTLGLIRDTIRALQGYAGNGEDLILQEETELVPALETALGIEEAAIVCDRITVRKVYSEVPRVVAPRAKLAHILINVVKNAVESMRSSGRPERILTLEVRPEREGVLVRISDTGEGVREEHRAKIFAYGFTTRQDGHGFSLHTCANHMTELGGTIQVESEGPGRGATFALYFPAKPRTSEDTSPP